MMNGNDIWRKLSKSFYLLLYFTGYIILYFAFNKIYLQTKCYNLFPCDYVICFTKVDRMESCLMVLKVKIYGKHTS